MEDMRNPFCDGGNMCQSMYGGKKRIYFLKQIRLIHCGMALWIGP